MVPLDLVALENLKTPRILLLDGSHGLVLKTFKI